MIVVAFSGFVELVKERRIARRQEQRRKAQLERRLAILEGKDQPPTTEDGPAAWKP